MSPLILCSLLLRLLSDEDDDDDGDGDGEDEVVADLDSGDDVNCFRV
jgi:hypothetical protein